MQCRVHRRWKTLRLYQPTLMCSVSGVKLSSEPNHLSTKIGALQRNASELPIEFSMTASNNTTLSKKLQVAGLTQGISIPSTRFRLLQYSSLLADQGVSITHMPAKFGAYPPAGLISRLGWFPNALGDAFKRSYKANTADVCFLQRELISTLRTGESLLRQPVVFDVDDAIFLHPRGRQSDATARQATLVICGNKFLAEHYGQFTQVVILPTAVDTERFHPLPYEIAPLVIGWSGSSANLHYLYQIEDALYLALEQLPSVQLHVVCDSPPTFRRLPPERVRYIRWNPNVEVAALQRFSVGLMPLSDTPWSRGKCSFKMLTYMAVGIPVIVSPVGMNVEVLGHGNCGFAAVTKDDWVDAICLLIKNQSLASIMGKTGRSITESIYAKKCIGPKLAQVLLEASYSGTVRGG